MNRAARLPARLAHTPLPAMLAWVVGAAAQLQQPQLWTAWDYGGLLALALMAFALAAIRDIPVALRVGCVVLAMSGLGFGVTGLRAITYMEDALDPVLEGRDVVVTGVVANLPQRNETGLRFRLQVESALRNGQPTRVPPRMDVGWYGGALAAGPGVALDTERVAPSAPAIDLNRQPAVVQAGERWQMTVRLKSPHGSRNPNGFDFELWLWEEGVQATAYVRATAKDPAPVRLAQTWAHPVTFARQIVRERITEQVVDRQAAGMLTALVVGDQKAIERGD